MSRPALPPEELGGDAPCWMHLFEDGEAPAGVEPPDLDSREHIECFVREFYRLAAVDELLGPIFHAAQVDWNAHIGTLTDFWSWQLLGEQGYDGNPLRAHMPAHERTPFGAQHFERWLELFGETLDAWFRGPNTELARARATKMARALTKLLSQWEVGDDLGEIAGASTPLQALMVSGPSGSSTVTDTTR